FKCDWSSDVCSSDLRGALRPHAWIYDADEYRAARKAADGRLQCQCSGDEVLRRDAVAEIDEQTVRRNPEDDPLHDPYERIGKPEDRKSVVEGKEVAQ